jgi:Tfp pilus assembly protein FimT
MQVESKELKITNVGRQRGFTLLQLLIVVLVIGVIGAMAVFGIVQARQRIRLTNSARLLASYLEKARVDSVRRHATAFDEMAGVTILNPSSYFVRYDMDGNGTLETRQINLDNGITLVNNPRPVRFDWRGRFVTDDPSITKFSFTLQYGTSSDQRTVDVTRSGDVTIDSREYLDDVPNVNVNSNLSGIDSGSTVNGNTNPTPTPSPEPSPTPSEEPTPVPPPPAEDPTPDPSPAPSPTPYPSPTPDPTASPSPAPSPTPQPTPTPSPAACVADISPSSLSFPKNGGSGSLSFTITGGSGSVSFVSGPGNLQVSQISTYNFQVTSINNSRGDFTLYFNTPCGSRQVTVTVTN